MKIKRLIESARVQMSWITGQKIRVRRSSDGLLVTRHMAHATPPPARELPDDGVTGDKAFDLALRRLLGQVVAPLVKRSVLARRIDIDHRVAFDVERVVYGSNSRLGLATRNGEVNDNDVPGFGAAQIQVAAFPVEMHRSAIRL